MHTILCKKRNQQRNVGFFSDESVGYEYSKKLMKSKQLSNNLNLQKYSCENIPSFYDCFGICNHSGNVNGGHYTSFSKNSQGKWYFYNDKEVQIVKDHSCMISEQAYCLFYRKK